MGRRKKQEEIIRKYIQLPKSLTEAIEAQKTGSSSFSDTVGVLLKKGLRQKISKYQGFRQIHVSHPFTCFKCQGKFDAGTLAWHEDETGAKMCLSCAIEHEMTTKDTVKLIVKKLELKRDIKALKIEREEEAEKYEEEHLERTASLQKLAVSEKITELIEEAKERKASWMRFYNQDYEIDGKSEKEAFEKFYRTEQQLTSVLLDLQKLNEEALKTREKLLREKALKKKRKKKVEQAA